ncbi:GNAT family N-acetyltransferase [Mycolicibacterium wolinskyi]|uniref:GNAT family N-acetyltransferase n=1 Tax=Mycolicibacterium wolinskyi TaxID=59750 RepID=UPI0039177B06
MIAHLHSSPSDFGAVTGALYGADPVLFTSELTTLRTEPWPADQVLLSVSNGGTVAGAAVQIRESVLLVSGLPPDASRSAADALASANAQLLGVRGTPANATAFTRAWRAVTGVAARRSSEDVLYRLGALTPPTGVAGNWRLAADPDAELFEHWLDAFYVDAFGAEPNIEANRGMLASVRAAGGHVLLWFAGDVPVSMARLHPAVLGTSRIGPVYTPSEHRGHGYAAAVTSAAAQFARDRGVSDVVLFADAANAVSNGVYKRIGFVPVAENVRYALSPDRRR